MEGVSGVGHSWSSNLSLRSPSRPCRSKRRVSSVVMMAVSVEKKAFTLQKSEEIFNAAKDLMPGGVNSPVRAFKSVGGQPIVFDSVKGSRMWDVDGNEYIDYVGSWGPAIIGHADDKQYPLLWSMKTCFDKKNFSDSYSAIKQFLEGNKHKKQCIDQMNESRSIRVYIINLGLSN